MREVHEREHDHDQGELALDITRRRFIQMVAVGTGGAFLAACAPGGFGGAAPSQSAQQLLSNVTWFGQSGFQWKTDTKVIYVDPGAWAKGKPTPPADVILFTHIHGDHFSKDDLGALVGPNTIFVAPADVAARLTGNVKTVKPGDSLEASGVKIQTVVAYNNGGDSVPHPQKNNWVGYIVDLGGKLFYHAGDTDNLPQLASVKADAAFVPIGGAPFTMTVDDAAALVKAIKPKVAVPMHFGYAQVPPGALGNKDKIIVGVELDGPKFRTAATPIETTILNPLTPYINK